MLVVADSNAVKFGVYGNPEVLKVGVNVCVVKV